MKMVVQNYAVHPDDVAYLAAASVKYGVSRSKLVRMGVDLLREDRPVKYKTTKRYVMGHKDTHAGRKKTKYVVARKR
jgi:hypothetical protein